MARRSVGMMVAAALAATLLSAAPAGAADASLNVVHGIPGADVNVCVDGAEAISDFNPGEVVTGVTLAAGAYDVKIVGAAADCDDEAILRANGLELASGTNVTAVAYLTADGTPTLGVFTNKVKPLAKATARVQVRHTAAAPEVDVWANGAPLVTGFENGDSATARVPKGVYAAWVSLPGDFEPVIGPAVLRLRAGHAYQVYAWGSSAAGYGFAVVDLDVGIR
jgi:Domain of unknown function (DUF4397)